MVRTTVRYPKLVKCTGHLVMEIGVYRITTALLSQVPSYMLSEEDLLKWAVVCPIFLAEFPVTQFHVVDTQREAEELRSNFLYDRMIKAWQRERSQQ